MFKQIALFTLATALVLSNVAVFACGCGRPAQPQTKPAPKNPPTTQKK